MATKKHSWWKWVLMLSIAILLLYFAFKGVKWSDFVSGLKSCNYMWIALSMTVSYLAFIVRAWRWRLIMLPLDGGIKRIQAYDGVTIGYLTNFALPRAGELARCGVISATGKASFEGVLGTVVLERSVDLLTYAFILLGVLIARWNQFGNFMTTEIWIPLSAKLQFNAWWLIVGIILILAAILVLMYIYRAKLRKYKFFDKFFKVCKGLVDGLLSGFKTPHKWKFLLLTILLWICYWLMSFFTVKSFPQMNGLNGVDALFLMVVGSLGWIIPVQGGIGAYHFIISLAISSLYAIPQTSGVVFATISHESQALVMIVSGAISLLAIYLRKRKAVKTQ